LCARGSLIFEELDVDTLWDMPARAEESN
jgi:hypothetical protein